MRKTKLLTCFVAGALAVSLTACGGNSSSSSSSTQGATEVKTEAPTPEETKDDNKPSSGLEAVAGSIDFEDGNYAFMEPYYGAPDSADVEVSIADFAGSKAVKVTSVGGTAPNYGPYIGIDVSSLLGDKITDVAKIQADVAVEYPDGTFRAVQGHILTWTGEDLKESDYSWSIYLENKNPARISADISETPFVTGSKNIAIIGLNPSSSADPAAVKTCSIYVDNIAFLDASGNVIEADTSVEFDEPDGFGKPELDPNLYIVSNPVTLEDFSVKNGAWSQAGRDLTDEEKALLVPGSVIEITYKCSAPVWIVAKAYDTPFTKPNGGWIRLVVEDQVDFTPIGVQDEAGTKIQVTYEDMVEKLGEDFLDHLSAFDLEGNDDWEVYSVVVGTKSNYKELASKEYLDDFSVKNGAWSQAGKDLSDEEKAMLVPGSVVEITFKCDEPVWLIAKAYDTPFTIPNGGWIRMVVEDQVDFTPLGSLSPDGTILQVDYDDFVNKLGEDFLDHLSALDCESSAEWEVYSVAIGMRE